VITLAALVLTVPPALLLKLLTAALVAFQILLLVTKAVLPVTSPSRCRYW